MSTGDKKPGEDFKKGSLRDVLLVEILGNAYARNLTGRLDLSRGKQKKEIYFLGGMPVYATSRDKNENVIEVTIARKHLSPDDAHQIRKLYEEKKMPAAELLKMLELLSDAELYALQAETFHLMIIDACGWNEGNYFFHEGEDFLLEAPQFDLNPLELIYQGIKSHHSLDLASAVQKAEKKTARLRHGWETNMALPEVYHQRSDVLDIFEQERTVGESIPRLYQEFGHLGDALLFLYILIITGLLEIQEPEPAAKAAEKRRAVHVDYALESPPPAPERTEETPAPTPEPGPAAATAPEPAPAPDESEMLIWPPLEPEREPAPVSEDPAEPPPLDLNDRDIIIDPGPAAAGHDATAPDTAFVSTAKVSDTIERKPSPPDESREKKRREEERKKLERLISDTRARFSEMEKKLSGAFDHFELLEADIEADYHGIRAAWEKKLDQISFDRLPPEYQAEFELLRNIFAEAIDRAYNTLIDPDERIAHEETGFNKRRSRAATTDMQQKLAIQQWKRGQWYLNAANRPDLARRCFHQAIELDNTKPQYYAYVGWAVYKKNPEGDIKEALDYLNHAVSLNSAYDQAHYFLGVIAKRRGDQQTAASHFRHALRVNPEHHQARREYELIKSRAKQDGLLSRFFGKNQARA